MRLLGKCINTLSLTILSHCCAAVLVQGQNKTSDCKRFGVFALCNQQEAMQVVALETAAPAGAELEEEVVPRVAANEAGEEVAGSEGPRSGNEPDGGSPDDSSSSGSESDSTPAQGPAAAHYTFGLACASVGDVKRMALPKPQVQQYPVGDVQAEALPLRIQQAGPWSGAHIFDILSIDECPPLSPEMHEFLQRHEYTQLSAPYAPANSVEIPFRMDLIIIPGENGTTTVVKHFMAVGPKITWPVASALCLGQPRVLDMRGPIQ